MKNYLTDDELTELTDRLTAPARHRRLTAMGIPHIYEPKASLVRVLRSVAFRKSGERPAPREPEPDFSWMKRTA